MNRVILFSHLFFILFSLSIFGQSDQQREQIRREVFEQRQHKRKLDNLKGVEVEGINLSFFKLSNEDKQLTAPSEEDKKKIADFSRLSNVEIVKLLNISCLKAGQVKLDNACKNSIPGFGSYYSFRDRRYLYPSMSDLQLSKDWFVTAGFLTQGIIVSLGEVDFENISLISPGVNFLNQFTPAESPDEADKQRKQIEDGIKKDEFSYNRIAQVKVNNVYAMRSIAYRSKAKTLDKREDTILVFKVISRDIEGNVTLIWRKLKSKTAPKIKTENEN
ncbi:MAG TPA: hypothetical protein VF596_03155 [Pyrinomonadaceae bacterium]|jgi:hypothetical protein